MDCLQLKQYLRNQILNDIHFAETDLLSIEELKSIDPKVVYDTLDEVVSELIDKYKTKSLPLRYPYG